MGLVHELQQTEWDGQWCAGSEVSDSSKVRWACLLCTSSWVTSAPQPLHIFLQAASYSYQDPGTPAWREGDGETPSQVAHLTLTTVLGGWHDHPRWLEEDRLSEAKPFKWEPVPSVLWLCRFSSMEMDSIWTWQQRRWTTVTSCQ